MSPRTTSVPNNNLLTTLVISLFMIILALLFIYFIDNSSSLHAIRTTQESNTQKNNVQRHDLTSITCALWHTMMTSPAVHPSAAVTKQVTEVCGP